MVAERVKRKVLDMVQRARAAGEIAEKRARQEGGKCPRLRSEVLSFALRSSRSAAGGPSSPRPKIYSVDRDVLTSLHQLQAARLQVGGHVATPPVACADAAAVNRVAAPTSACHARPSSCSRRCGRTVLIPTLTTSLAPSCGILRRPRARPRRQPLRLRPRLLRLPRPRTVRRRRPQQPRLLAPVRARLATEPLPSGLDIQRRRADMARWCRNSLALSRPSSGRCRARVACRLFRRAQRLRSCRSSPQCSWQLSPSSSNSWPSRSLPASNGPEAPRLRCNSRCFSNSSSNNNNVPRLRRQPRRSCHFHTRTRSPPALQRRSRPQRCRSFRRRRRAPLPCPPRTPRASASASRSK
jgi:hypothetical protein